MSWMFHITGCVVQAAVAKAQKVSDEKKRLSIRRGRTSHCNTSHFLGVILLVNF